MQNENIILEKRFDGLDVILTADPGIALALSLEDGTPGCLSKRNKEIVFYLIRKIVEESRSLNETHDPRDYKARHSQDVSGINILVWYDKPIHIAEEKLLKINIFEVLIANGSTRWLSDTQESS